MSIKNSVLIRSVFLVSISSPSSLLAYQQGNFNDGSFEEVGKLKDDLQKSAPDIAKAAAGSPLVAGWSKIVMPDASLPGWDTAGDVKIVKIGANHVVQLHSNNTPASVGQLINFKPQAKTMEFDVTTVPSSSDGTLAVLLNKQTLQQFKLSELKPHESIPLIGNTSFESQAGKFPPSGVVMFQLTGAPESIVQLDNLVVMY